MGSNLHPTGVQLTYRLRIKRELALSATRTSLAGTIKRTQQKQARVLLAEVHLPPDYGPTHNEQFASAYCRLSEEYKVPLVAGMLNRSQRIVI